MSNATRIQDLSAQEIFHLLTTDGNSLTAEQVTALCEFIEDIGGLENAYAAVEMLCALEEAA